MPLPLLLLLAVQDAHAGHVMPAPTSPAQHQHAPAPSPPPADPHAGHVMTTPGKQDHATMDHGATTHAMPAMLGPYPMSREASGTAWQPDAAPMIGRMLHSGDWSGMAQGWATLVHSDQGGPRGDRETFSQSMAMLMGSRPVGANGRLGLRAMLSLDPLMGRSGYPSLFSTGETADGVTELVDRQHPHDFVMELAASYAHDLGGGRALSLYAGLPGEPALGPPTFMHRVSGLDSPEAPIAHHWFDSTHITWGVVTAGYSTRTWKIEASAFRGREPDQRRWDLEAPRLDSWSVRGFWNPTANLSFQLSTGFIKSPEQLHPDENEQRTTASATWSRPTAGGNLAATVAWSLKDGLEGEPALHAWLAEGAWRFGNNRNLLFARGEVVDEGELFGDADPRHHDVFTVGKLSLGYQRELPLGRDTSVAVGGLVSAYAYPRAIRPDYGGEGVKSAMLYLRLNYGLRQ